jgi:hypothetical protein
VAENDEEMPWSENADVVIEGVSQTINDKYGVALKDILTKPAFYVSKKGMETTFSNIREEVGNYIQELAKSMDDDRKNMEKDGLKCDAVTKQLAQNISMQAKQNNIPIIKPASMDRNTDNDEVIYVNNIDNGVMALLAKLSANSSFIADFSTTYKTYNLGQWLFDGQKNFLISVAMEPNPYMDLDSAKDEINMIMDGVEGYFKSQGSSDEGQEKGQ